ncbi:MAG: succinate dehydrogenase cytochrome b subunit [Deltaproteobacteria bacterium]|nr:succinate dehydrogenase cytochrome b subunit [Deltaproteobacteria bacterium]
MSALVRFLSSSIGRKMLMGASGLLLLAFLLVHVAGNLVLFAGRDVFNGYSHHLVSNPLIYVAELGLLALFAAHLVSGIAVTVRNRKARPDRYVVKGRAGGKSHKSVASSTMILSGIFLIAFVPLHLWTFKWGPIYPSPTDPAVRDLHRLVIEEFHEPLEVAWYVGAMLIIGCHLWHAFASGLESLGVGDRDWLRRTGNVLAVVVTVGFVVVPIAIWLGWVPA